MPGKIVLETDRLRLREWTLDDVPMAAPLFADPLAMRYIGEGKAVPYEQVGPRLQAAIDQYTQFGFGLWAVVYKETGEVIGHAGMKYWDKMDKVEVGYLLAQPYWGQGLAFEAAQAAVTFGFEQKQLPEIIALIDRPNLASSNVARKLGMTFDREIDFGYKWTDCFRIDRAEYFRRKASHG